MADFLINTLGLPAWLAWTVAAVVAAVLILHVIAGGALVFIWAERKIAGRIQDRLGPTRTGGARARLDIRPAVRANRGDVAFCAVILCDRK
jgi:hypothetical protein